MKRKLALYVSRVEDEGTGQAYEFKSDHPRSPWHFYIPVFVSGEEDGETFSRAIVAEILFQFQTRGLVVSEKQKMLPDEVVFNQEYRIKVVDGKPRLYLPITELDTRMVLRAMTLIDHALNKE